MSASAADDYVDELETELALVKAKHEVLSGKYERLLYDLRRAIGLAKGELKGTQKPRRPA